MLQMSWDIKKVDRICLTVIVVVSLVCGYLVVSRVSHKKQQFRIEKEILSKRMNEADVASANLMDLKAALLETKAELNSLNERIPVSGKIGLFLRQVDALMTRRDIVMVSIRPLAAIEEKNYLKIPIHLVFTGAFVDIYQLMKDIEQMNRIVIMENMTINRQETAPYCQAELDISVFEQSGTP
jgi:Tfp pilus assembly protein PilO